MEATDEAKDWAPQVEERVDEINKNVKKLLLELENIT